VDFPAADVDSDEDGSYEDEDVFWKPLDYQERPKEEDRVRRREPTFRGKDPLLPDMHGISSVQSTRTTMQSRTNSGFYTRDYESCLGYPYGDLKFFLTAKRNACHRRFELSVDEITFLGHPVCAQKDFSWSLSPDTDELEDDHRGRVRAVSGSSYGKATPASTEPASESGQVTDESVPLLSQFHLVLVIDKPDPVSFNCAPNVLYDTLYEEIAFKWTAAAFAEQARTGWVARECLRLGQVHEDSVNRREYLGPYPSTQLRK
jgi:hypothetical protein